MSKKIARIVGTAFAAVALGTAMAPSAGAAIAAAAPSPNGTLTGPISGVVHQAPSASVDTAYGRFSQCPVKRNCHPPRPNGPVRAHQ